MQTYDRIQDEVPGRPAAGVGRRPGRRRQRARGAGRHRQAAEGGRRHQGLRPAGHRRRRTRGNDLAIVDIPLAGDGTDAKLGGGARQRCATAWSRRRSASVPGVEVNVTGMTAGSKDFNDTIKSHLPIVFAFVLGLAFILLLVTFRSIVIPIKAIVLNLLSVGAAYGILTLVFQDGHGESLLGFHSLGGDHVVAAAVPVRDPVRAVDGLPRVHPQPDPRGGRRRHEHRPRGRARHQADRRRGHERGDRDGRGVLDLRDAELARSSSRWASASRPRS